MTEIVGSLKNNLSTAEHKILANITRIQKSSLHKKRSFPLSISTVNVTKSAVSFGFGHIYRRNKLLFLSNGFNI